MEPIVFKHAVSKGSRYKQIYIPREMERYFDAGDLVEIRLIKKKENLRYSKHLKKLNEFKKRLIEDIFKTLKRYKEIQQVFVIGSFLTKKADYRDIDIVLLLETDNPQLEKRIFDGLTEAFALKFHVITAKKESLQMTLRICPLTRSMFYHFVSDKLFSVPRQYKVEKNHLRYLIMYPEDLLTVDLDESRAYYDALRRLICIEHFLQEGEIAPEKIDGEITRHFKENTDILQTTERIPASLRESIKSIIKGKIQSIRKILEENHGKEKRHR